MLLIHLQGNIEGRFEATRDVIDDVIIMKILFGIIWDDLFISEVKLKLCLISKTIINGRFFELVQIFSDT